MLKRKWIGVDVSVKAFELVKKRLKKEIKPDLLDPEKEVNFSTEAPKRTDLGEKTQNLKWVYVISNPAYKGEYKVGSQKTGKQDSILIKPQTPTEPIKWNIKRNSTI